MVHKLFLSPKLWIYVTNRRARAPNVFIALPRLLFTFQINPSARATLLAVSIALPWSGSNQGEGNWAPGPYP